MRRQLMRSILAFLLCIAVCGMLAAQQFYKTPSGKKYHLGSCRMVENVSQEITLEQAIKLGLGPCGICHPSIAPLQLTPPNTPRGNEATVRCKGQTKAGMRCQHMTSIANGF